MGEENGDRYRWQQLALDAWERAGSRGIIEAMTGTGKTMVAIQAIRRMVARGQRVSPLVVVPTRALLEQWYAVLCKEFPGQSIGRIGDGHGDDFSQAEGGALPAVCVATVHSAVRAVEGGLFDHCASADHRSLLIADECHRYSNEEQKLFNRILRHPYDFTLGLSATIDRYAIEGLGKIEFSYGIREGVRDGLIPRFTVLNIGVDLTRTELQEYLKLSNQIRDRVELLKEVYPELERVPEAFFWHRVKALGVEEDNEENGLISTLMRMFFRRAAIAYTCQQKLDLAPRLIHTLVSQGRKKALVFFERIWTAEASQMDLEDHAMRELRTALRDGDYADDAVACFTYHSGLSDRQRVETLERFRASGPSALLACRSLDEGLDVPSVEAAVLVAATRSPRQRLQRIGRTLRRGDGEKQPVVIILYARGTGDDDSRIDANDNAFQGAADIYDVPARDCVRVLADLLDSGVISPALVAGAKARVGDLAQTGPAAPAKSGAGLPLSRLRAGSTVDTKLAAAGGRFREAGWKQLGKTTAESTTQLRHLRKGISVGLVLTDGRTFQGSWVGLLPGGVACLSPAVQVRSDKVVAVYVKE